MVLFVVEAGRYGDDDRAVLALLPPDAPAILVVNKIDRLAGPARMLPFLERMSKARAFRGHRAGQRGQGDGTSARC